MALSQRLRFEILKRDAFTCQYCGRRPPAVILHVDHITPRAAGGADEEGNLITSCGWCNLGKGSAPLEPPRECTLCGEADESVRVMFQLPSVEMGRYMAERIPASVCGECLDAAVHNFVYALNPDHLRCAACGDFYALNEPCKFKPITVLQGSAAWVCPPCSDKHFTAYEGGPSVTLYQPRES